MTAPRFSIITPVYDTPESVLREMLESVLAQTFTDWEHVLVDDCSPDPRVREVLREYAAADNRFKVIERSTNGHIVRASNDGVDASSGELISLLDHDDLLEPDALMATAAAFDSSPDVDYVYTDEDKVDMGGRRFDPFNKPDWSPERFRGHMYVCHFSTMRGSIVRELGGFRDGFDGSQDHDLVLRVSERARRVVHVPRVLYHWRIIPGSAAGDPNAKPYAWVAGRKAVQEHVDRTGIRAAVEYGPGPGYYRLERRLQPGSRVSIVIPTRGGSALVWGEWRVLVVEAVRSILQTAPKDLELEVVVVYDVVTDPGILETLRELAGDRLVLVPFSEKFNFSRKSNLGAVYSSGDYLVMLNDDVQPRDDRWLTELVAPLDEPDVGLTGSMLFYADGYLQHAGHRYHDGDYRHVFAGRPGDDPGPWSVLWVNHEVSGVTGAACAIRRDVFAEIGGFSEALPVNYNDVDLSYKVRHRGYRILLMEGARLYHFESQTRETHVHPYERSFVLGRWGRPERDEFLPTLT